MRIDRLLKRVKALSRIEPLYLCKFSDETETQMTGHDALVSAIKGRVGMGQELARIEPTSDGEAFTLAKAILDIAGDKHE